LNELKYPKDERVWMRYYNKNHELLFILTSKNIPGGFYFLYELISGEFKKLGKARSPKELEEKYSVLEKIGVKT